MAKILVVEDTDLVRDLVSSALEDEGHSVVQAKDGREGLELLLQNPDTDMIITDFDMPKVNGYQLSKTVREDPLYVAHKDKVIIGMTAATHDEWNPYITKQIRKPFNPIEFLKLVAEYCK